MLTTTKDLLQLAVFRALHLLTKDLRTKFGQQQPLADSALLTVH